VDVVTHQREAVMHQVEVVMHQVDVVMHQVDVVMHQRFAGNNAAHGRTNSPTYIVELYQSSIAQSIKSPIVNRQSFNRQ